MAIIRTTTALRSRVARRRIRTGYVRTVILGVALCATLGVGLCVGLGVLFVGGLFALTQPVVDASEQFLSLLGQQKIDEAYASAADALRAQQDAASFATAVQQLGLTGFSSASWHNREISNQEGLAEGTLTTKNGDTKPISVRLVKERGKWKVISVSVSVEPEELSEI